MGQQERFRFSMFSPLETERSLLDGSAAPCCPISWHTRRCPRVARSSGSAETQAATQAQEETEFARLFWLEMVQGGYDDTTIDQEISKVGGCLIIDAKGVFDAIHRSESAVLSMQDKRSAVEGLALRDAIGRTRTLLRWCHSEPNVAGALTKVDNRAHELSRKFLQSRVWRIVWDPEFTDTAEEKKTVKNFMMDVRCINRELRDECTMNQFKSFVMGASFFFSGLFSHTIVGANFDSGA